MERLLKPDTLFAWKHARGRYVLFQHQGKRSCAWGGTSILMSELAVSHWEHTQGFSKYILLARQPDYPACFKPFGASYLSARDIDTTHSTCLVWGNMSTGTMRFTR